MDALEDVKNTSKKNIFFTYELPGLKEMNP